MSETYRTLTTAELLGLLDKMIRLVDKHANRPFDVPSGSIPFNVFFVHSNFQHAINLSRGIVTLYRANQAWEAIPNMRVAMECAVTAAWGAVTPDQTGGVVLSGAKERRQLLKAVSQFGIDTTDATAETQEVIDRFLSERSDAAEHFLNLCNEISGGDTFYTSYRAISRLVHPGTELTDFYTARDNDPANVFHLSLLSDAAFDHKDAHGWLGHHACMMVIAFRAVESLLVKPEHSTQIESWAKKLGGVGTVEFLGKTERKDQTLVSFAQSVEARAFRGKWGMRDVAIELREVANRLERREKPTPTAST